MSRRNTILLTPDKATRVEGIIAASITPKPGTILQVDPTVALQGGRHTWKLYDRAATGDRPAGPYIVLMEDQAQGKSMTDAYAAGERAFGCIPHMGCELNLLFDDVSGTGATSDVVAGGMAIVVDGTGLVINTTGSPQTEVAMWLESQADLTADTLIWSQWTMA